MPNCTLLLVLWHLISKSSQQIHSLVACSIRMSNAIQIILETQRDRKAALHTTIYKVPRPSSAKILSARIVYYSYDVSYILENVDMMRILWNFTISCLKIIIVIGLFASDFTRTMHGHFSGSINRLSIRRDISTFRILTMIGILNIVWTFLHSIY